MFRHVIDVDGISRIDFGTGNDGYKRDWMEDVIVSHRAKPERRELLRNEDINSVSESVLYEGEKPGTIRAPALERRAKSKSKPAAKAKK